MLYNLTKSQEQLAPVIIRCMLALVIFPHGAQKLLGWFGGYGFSGTMEFFTAIIGLPWLVGFMVITIEFFVPWLLMAGVFVRLSAATICGLFVGIISTSHIQYGFFMNWNGTQQGEGYEYHLLILGMAAALILSGGGKYAVDQFLAKKYHDT